MRFAFFNFLLIATVSPAQTIQYADKFPGADAGEKITKCIDALPPQGGVCDARELTGKQTALAAFNVGGPDKPVELMLGPVTLVTGDTIHVQARSSIVGMPAAMGIGSYQSATVIQAADNAVHFAVVQVDGPLAVLQDLTVDGNARGTQHVGVCISVNGGSVGGASRIEMFRVTAQNSPANGIDIYSGNRNESCCAKLSKVMAIANGHAGLAVHNTADVMIEFSEFENNGTFGIELSNSPTTRIEHSRLSGNWDGITISGTAFPGPQSNREMIIGNQFANNRRYDIHLLGFDNTTNKHVSNGNLISSNQFIGGSIRPPSYYEAIQIVNSGENTIIGNTFSATSDHAYSACITISGDYELADQVSGNTCTESATAGKVAFIGTSTTVFANNQGKVGPAPKPGKVWPAPKPVPNSK